MQEQGQGIASAVPASSLTADKAQARLARYGHARHLHRVHASLHESECPPASCACPPRPDTVKHGQ